MRGDLPTFRADQMPYGGWKASGSGREGVASAMDDLTDVRILVLTGLPLQEVPANLPAIAGAFVPFLRA